MSKAEGEAPNSSEESGVLRDFVYLDVDRLTSLYSQVFEGVARSITESVMDEEQRTESQKGAALSGRSIEEQMAHASQKTISQRRLKLLYGSSVPGTRWTMVGHVTYNPLAVKAAEQARQSFAGGASDEENNLRDSVRNMAWHLSDFEEQTLRSGDSLEFHVMPIAIYRETEIGDE